MGKHLQQLLLDTQDRDIRIAPDPMAVVLPGLAGLGAIASIAAIDWVGNQRAERPSGPRRRVATVLRDLERVTTDLEDVFRRLNRNFRMFVNEHGAPAAPPKFGVHGLNIPQRSFHLYQALVVETAGLVGPASQCSFDVMCLIEEGQIEPPQETFYALSSAQERLSHLLRERMTLLNLLDESQELARGLRETVQELKAFRVA